MPAHIVDRLRTRYAGIGVCVTGGAGFIGGHLVDALVSLGARINVIDDLSNSNTEHLAGLIELEPERVRFFHGSILDDEAMREATDGVKVVFHLAAVGSVPLSIEQPQRSWSVNSTGTVRVLEAARAAKASRVVFSASSSAYGLSEVLPRRESEFPTPISPYAASKLAGEGAMMAWAHSYGLSTISLRYFNIFGPRQSADSAYAAVVSAFAKRLLAGEAPVIHGDGGQSRDFTHVTNAVLANLLAGSSQRLLKGEVANIGTGRRISVRELAEAMTRACAGPEPAILQPRFEPARAGDVRDSQADIARARELLGYEPVVSFEEGLAETIAWYKESLARA
ncbi:MAG: SDR family NAD(P)-dependent oxidoreductase [Phycisphaerales bacterium]|nr:SDR family NAD(P)-dependent oxidoreductase [Phycisphaerales bacterium]